MNRTVQPTPNEKDLVEILAYNQEEKLALLSITHRFNLDNIFQYIKKEIPPDEISVLDRIRLGNKYEMNEWLVSAYKDIIDRTGASVTEEESKALGSEEVIKLLQVKNSMLFERLENAESYITSIGHGFAYMRVERGEIKSTEEIVKEYFTIGQAGMYQIQRYIKARQSPNN
jgi:hypothetical protein